MSRAFFGEALGAAARFEAERRRRSFPKLVQSREIGAEAATLNYQAWCALAEWFETGSSSIINSWGGVADPPVTVIDWPLLEQAAAKELEAVEGKLGQEEDAELRARRDRLFTLHLVVKRQRDFVAETNAIARRERDERLRERQAA